ncbi:AMP-binding protein [Orrella sp. 11846]|uniref:AMP-binding protein n=1 Tax=Orrella sp. 11846 TaxID=3409913 RepID=UPI003B5A9871
MTDQYRSLVDEYAWHIPRDFNLAHACCFQWEDLPSHSKSVAIEIVGPDGYAQTLTFQGLAQLANKLALGLDRMGARVGDRVGIIMRERTEALALLMACWHRQCIAVPLPSTEHGDILTQRIRQARCRLVFIDDSEPDKVLGALQRCQRVQQIVGLDVRADNVMDWHGLLSRQLHRISSEPTRPQQPALLVWPNRADDIYPPQTAYLLAHQSLIGNLPGFVCTNNWFPDNATGMLTTHAMMSESGLLGTILPSLYFGVGVRVQATLPHDPEILESSHFELSHLNTNVGLLCHWLKHTEPSEPFAFTGVGILGEHLSEHWRERAKERLGVEINLCSFISGCGLLWGDSQVMWPASSHHSGRVFPGHQITQAPEPETDEPEIHLANCDAIYAHRTDPAGDTDPAMYVGVWPLKEPADILEPIEIATRHPVGLFGKLEKSGDIQLIGWKEDALQVNGRCTHPLVIEQAVMAMPEISMAAAIQPQTKEDPQTIESRELWLILELDGSLNFAQAVRQNLATQILEQIAPLIETQPIQIGVISRISIDNQGHPRRDLLRLRHGLSGVQLLPIGEDDDADS